MAVTAEKRLEPTAEAQWDLLELELRIQDVLIVPEMPTDEATRQRAAHFIGAIALGGEISREVTQESPLSSLHEAILQAGKGDKQALALIKANVKADVIERTIKTGHVMDPVPLAVTDTGKIIQHGQSMDSIQANSLLYAADHPVMRARTEAETRNAFRIEELNRTGFFDDYCFVVLSRAENLPQAGFFRDTMSCCMQVTSKEGNGLVTESAFVSGIASPGSFRHDEQTIINLGYCLQADFAGKTPAEIIDTPLLVHKSRIPNGVIDLVELYDDCAGGKFFGEDVPRQDYLRYLAICRQRQKTFDHTADIITDELLSSANSVNSPTEAIEKLHKLSEKHMVERAVIDKTIDPRVFGIVSAGYIIQARLAAEQSDWGGIDHYVQKAKDSAQSSSCPGKLLAFDASAGEGGSDKNSTDKDCDFVSNECPVCHKKDVKTRVTKTHISGDCGCKVRR